MHYVSKLGSLTDDFINAYPASRYPELMCKIGRPYNCLLIDSHTDYFICLPFRSHINHSNAFMFKQSRRSITNKSGIDYSKMVIIKEPSYLEIGNVVVDQDEYNEAVQNLDKIVKDSLEYLEKYIKHIRGTSPMHPREFERNYKFTTLKYFHDVLGLPLPF